MSIQPTVAASSYPLALSVKKQRVLKSHTIDSVPDDIFGKILHYLDARDIQAMASVSLSIKNRVITEANDSEPPALINFTKHLIQRLNVERFSRESGS